MATGVLDCSFISVHLCKTVIIKTHLYGPRFTAVHHAPILGVWGAALIALTAFAFLATLSMYYAADFALDCCNNYAQEVSETLAD